MNTLRILMIEDNPWLGSILQELIVEVAEAEIIVLRSVAAAEKALAQSKFDFAFLDVNVTDGKTYELAAALMKDEIPFAFMSGFDPRHDIPENLRKAPVLAKPFRPASDRIDAEPPRGLIRPFPCEWLYFLARRAWRSNKRAAADCSILLRFSVSLMAKWVDIAEVMTMNPPGIELCHVAGLYMRPRPE